MKEIDRIPPQAVEIEEVFLGALLIEPDSIPDVKGILPPEAFYKTVHQIIYKHMLDLHKKSKVDILTLTQYLRDNGDLETVGGAVYITKLTSRVASAAHIKYHLSIIYDKWVARDCIKIGSEMIKSAHDADDILDSLQAARDAMDQRILQFLGINSTGITIIDAANKSIDDYYTRELAYKNGHYSGIPTTLKELNRITGGMQKQQLIILAARPGMGKTSMAINFVMTAAKFKARCAFFSLEMTSERLADKVICALAEIDYSAYKRGRMIDNQKKKAEECLDIINHWQVKLNDTMLADIEQVHANCRKLKDNEGLDFVIIDYLQLMRTKERTGNREQEISTMSRKAKLMAVDLNIPVLLISQLNRSVEIRGNKRPMLSDLRESGAIEQDADIVLFIYRDSEYEKSAPIDEGELIVAKHREGERKIIKFKHNESMTCISDYDEESLLNIDKFSPESKEIEPF